MAFDGITVAGMVQELNHTIVGGRINKIAQPEADELLITIKNQRTQYRLLISASASLPLIYLTDKNKPGPLSAPNFCMLLRKHIGSGKITAVTQPGLERVIAIRIEHLNELGDPCSKTLMTEIMGKHSNIIFLNEEGRILDSIKHVSSHMSSVREVLPGREYFIPKTREKLDPLCVSPEDFYSQVYTKPLSTAKALYTSFTGLSPVMGEELCYRASIDGGTDTAALTDTEKTHLYHTFLRTMEEVKEGAFSPNIVYRNNIPIEYAALKLQQYEDHTQTSYPRLSQVLEHYYAEKNAVTRIRQKSADLRRIVQTALERNRKKYELQAKQLKDTDKMDKYRIYGELINTYGYNLEEGCKSFKALNYYTDKEITIPLNPDLSAMENSKKYFDRYSKLKRTKEALTSQIRETESEIAHLESISTALDMAREESDLTQLKEELIQYGYLRRKGPVNKKIKVTSRPLHYISSDGYHMYVGKNNFQNEEITFKLASGNDWWFHAKGQPGSHVIVKTNGEELPDRTFEEAGRLAAYYSKGRQAPKVEIDYIQKKHIKKPSGAKPGFVVYYTNYSLLIEPDISGLHEIV